MESLNSLVKKYFPDESIINEVNVKLKDIWVGKVGRIPLSATMFFYLKSMPMIETDKKYYFDKRVPILFQSILDIFIGPLCGLIFLFVIQTLEKTNYPKEIYMTIFILGIVVGIINIFINNNTILNVIAVDKTWISENYQKNGETILKGFIPNGNASYYLYSHISQEKLDKKIMNKFPKKTFYGLSFTLKYKKVN